MHFHLYYQVAFLKYAQLNKNNNVCCCESFLAFPNLDEANILAKTKTHDDWNSSYQNAFFKYKVL